MKKTRFIPLLALTALLTSCDLFGGNKLKEPSFAKEGEEVSYNDFTSRVQQAFEESEINDSESLLGDRIEKYTVSQSQVRTTKMEKKEISSSNTVRTQKSESQCDADNLVSKATGETKYESKSSSEEGSSSETSTSNTESYLQFEKVNGQMALIFANVKTESYIVSKNVSARESEEDVFDSSIRSSILSIYSSFAYSIPSSQTDAKEYMFFINNDTLFTFSQNTDQDEDTADYKVSTKIKLKAQFDFTSKKEAFRYSYQVRTEYTYKRNYQGYKEGQVETIESKSYVDYSMNGKSVTVKPLDISDYQYNNY